MMYMSGQFAVVVLQQTKKSNILIGLNCDMCNLLEHPKLYRPRTSGT